MINTNLANPRIRSINDGEFRSRTGRGWLEWQTTLDAWNADNRHLRATIAHLREKHGLNLFWAQVIGTHYMLERLQQ